MEWDVRQRAIEECEVAESGHYCRYLALAVGAGKDLQLLAGHCFGYVGCKAIGREICVTTHIVSRDEAWSAMCIAGSHMSSPVCRLAIGRLMPATIIDVA